MKPMFEASPDTDLLVAFLRHRQDATHEQMGTLLGREINGRDRHILTSARRQLEREGRGFVAVRGWGIRRATNGQLAKLSTDIPQSKAKRSFRRANRRGLHVNIQDLTANERLAFYGGVVINNLLLQNLSRKSKNRVQRAIEQHGNEPISTQAAWEALSAVKPRRKGTPK